MDVARTLVLPDFALPSSGMLATLALFWESIELPIHPASPDPLEEERGIFEALIDQGVVHVHHLPAEANADAYRAEAAQIASAWACTPPGTTAATIDLDIADRIVIARAHRVARILRNRVETAVELAGDLWAAPVAATPFGFLASSLPKQRVELPVAEATLIHLAVSGAVIDPATPIDRLLKFREQHKELAGRLRGSLTDVAATIRSDQPLHVVVRQAEAALKNRVEPALSALETELKRGRISYMWSNVLGVGGVLATGVHPTAATIGGGAQLVGRGIRYAFDRDALVRDHPFGYLHKVRTSFLDDGASPLEVSSQPRTVPVPDLETLMAEVYVAAFRATPRDGFMTQMVGERSTDAAVCAKYMRDLAEEVQGRQPERWWTRKPATAE